MSGINLALPMDIPWKLLATSNDMMDKTFGNDAFPPKWRSSIAIFSFEPPDVPEELKDRKITYFKIACTITGYQTDKVDRQWIDFGALTPEVVNDMSQHLNRYYACHGALLQVAILPATDEDRANLAKYPVVTDFEPKRRDLYEMVTDTGEVLSNSSNRVAVNKGFTSTLSTESSSSLGGNLSVGSDPGSTGGVSASGGLTGSLAGKQSFGTQDATITQVDYAREKRESQSHATSLTQMYNLLQGYHLGTNRAVFLMQPRPHTVEQVEKRTFINGPREIEGVQEFFLIVSRPKDVADLCIEAHLETGHLDMNPADSDALTADTRTMTFDFKAPRTIETSSSIGSDSTSKTVALSKSFTPPTGWEIDIDQGQTGYLLVEVEGSAAYNVQGTVNGITVTGTVVTTYVDVAWSTENRYEYQDIRGELLIFIKKKKTAIDEAVKNTFFVTARSVAGCTGRQLVRPQLSDWLVFEWPVRVDPRLFSPKAVPGVRMRLSNELSMQLGRLMLESQHARLRYGKAKVDFHQSQFVLDRLASVLRRKPTSTSPHRRTLGELALDPALITRLQKVLGPGAVADSLLTSPLGRLREATANRTSEEALALKWKALGFGPKNIPS